MEAVELLPGYDYPDEILSLFTEYTDMLVRLDPVFQRYLDIQHYEEEVRDLSAKYGPLDGRLYLARADGHAAGCIALRKLDQERCEMKRLYVRPAYRGRHIARRLVDRLIADARDAGYRRMLLDTLPCLSDAVRMYRKLGFHDIPRYNDSPLDTTLFMELELSYESEIL